MKKLGLVRNYFGNAGFNEKTITIDGTFYYYTISDDSICHGTRMSVRVDDRVKVSMAILDILRMAQIGKEHRMVVSEFLFYEMFSICRDIYLSDEVTRIAVNGLMQMFKSSIDQEELLLLFFSKWKEKRRSILVEMIQKSKD